MTNLCASKMRLKLLCCFAWLSLIYECETWTITYSDVKKQMLAAGNVDCKANSENSMDRQSQTKKYTVKTGNRQTIDEM